jgi:hypothetical protein
MKKKLVKDIKMSATADMFQNVKTTVEGDIQNLPFGAYELHTLMESVNNCARYELKISEVIKFINREIKQADKYVSKDVLKTIKLLLTTNRKG